MTNPHNKKTERSLSWFELIGIIILASGILLFARDVLLSGYYFNPL